MRLASWRWRRLTDNDQLVNRWRWSELLLPKRTDTLVVKAEVKLEDFLEALDAPNGTSRQEIGHAVKLPHGRMFDPIFS